MQGSNFLFFGAVSKEENLHPNAWNVMNSL